MDNISQLNPFEKTAITKINLLINFFSKFSDHKTDEYSIKVFSIKGKDLGYYLAEIGENIFAGNEIINLVRLFKNKGLEIEQSHYDLSCQSIVVIEDLEVAKIFGTDSVEIVEKLADIKNSILKQNQQIYKITFVAKKQVIKKGKHKSEEVYGYFVNDDYNDFKEFRNKRNPVIKLAELELGEIQSIDKITSDTINRTSCAIYMKSKYEKTTITTPKQDGKFSISKNVQVRVISEKELTKIKNKKAVT